MSKTTPSGVQTGYSNGWRDKLNCDGGKRKDKVRHFTQQNPVSRRCTGNVMNSLNFSKEGKYNFLYLQWSNGSRLKFDCGMTKKQRTQGKIIIKWNQSNKEEWTRRKCVLWTATWHNLTNQWGSLCFHKVYIKIISVFFYNKPMVILTVRKMQANVKTCKGMEKTS